MVVQQDCKFITKQEKTIINGDIRGDKTAQEQVYTYHAITKV